MVLPPVEEAKDMALREVEGRRVEDEESAVPLGEGRGGWIVEEEEGEGWREGVEEED